MNTFLFFFLNLLNFLTGLREIAAITLNPECIGMFPYEERQFPVVQIPSIQTK